VGTGLPGILTRLTGAAGGIVARTGRRRSTLLPLVTGPGIRIAVMSELTRGNLLGLLLLARLLVTLPAVAIALAALPAGGIAWLALPPGPLTIPAVGITPPLLPLMPWTIPAIGLSAVLPLIPAAIPPVPPAIPAGPLPFPAAAISLIMLPLPVLPLIRLTVPAVGVAPGGLPPGPLALPAVGIARRMVLALPPIGIAPGRLGLIVPRLILEAHGMTTGLLKLGPRSLKYMGVTPGRLKLRPLPLEYIGVPPGRLRGEGPAAGRARERLMRPGQGVGRAEGQGQAHSQDNTQPSLPVHALLPPKLSLHIRLC
jgi:hypothetical protein